MLSYRHAFHAGGPADVLKHAVLAFTLAQTTRTPAPLYVLDTHAGAGLYDLSSAMAAKTGEAAAGALRLIGVRRPWPALLEALAPFLSRLPAYPGSARIGLAFLRPTDRMELVELHPTDHDLLRAGMADAPRVHVVRDDGLRVLRARMPPAERRGLVLIDPSYEIKSDYEGVARGLTAAHRRFPRGVFLLWYPVIDRTRTEAMIDRIRRSGTGAMLRIELAMAVDSAGRGMTGSGMLVFNPPGSLAEAAGEALPWLAARLGAAGPCTVRWLVPI